MNRSPLLARTLPGLVALAAASLSGPAAAQSGHRIMVVDEGDGPSILSVDLPDIRALRTPDFVRDDMPLFDRKLRLAVDQRATVRTLLDDYLEAFAALSTTHLPTSGPGMFFAGGDHAFFGGGDHEDGEHGGGGVFLHALGGPDGSLAAAHSEAPP